MHALLYWAMIAQFRHNYNYNILPPNYHSYNYNKHQDSYNYNAHGHHLYF
jgi:hypothetical protein